MGNSRRPAGPAARRRCAAVWAATLALCVPAVAVAMPDDAAEPARQRRSEPLPSFTVEVHDGVFRPSELTVPAGRRIKIVLVNHGPGPLEFEHDGLNVEKVLNAGARSFVVLPPLQAGAHEFTDEFNPITGVLTLHAR